MNKRIKQRMNKQMTKQMYEWKKNKYEQIQWGMTWERRCEIGVEIISLSKKSQNLTN